MNSIQGWNELVKELIALHNKRAANYEALIKVMADQIEQYEQIVDLLKAKEQV